ncbi:MAG TPA: response regulator [Flavobacterium sp.]|jgi:CheY-like chemotaxis protein
MSDVKSYKILLADDDPDDRDLFEEAFAGLNADIHTVENGVELMKVLEAGNDLPDFIFLDLNMPERNGKECLREIRQKNFGDVRVIIYSTSSNAKDIDDTFALGADLYVKKPNTFTELIKTAESILTLDWDQEQAPRPRTDFVFKAS